MKHKLFISGMYRLFKITTIILAIFGVLNVSMAESMKMNNSNLISNDRMLLVLAAPSQYDIREMGKEYFNDVIQFHINYAEEIMGHDNVVIIVDEGTAPLYSDDLPEDVLLVVEEPLHIWMRDFTTVNPMDPVQGIYTWAIMSKRDSKKIQKTFGALVDKYKIKRRFSELIFDGGNVVDNYAGKAVITKRLLKDNKLGYDEGKKLLKDVLGFSHVAFIEEEYGDYLGHSDGIAMWVEEDILLVNDYRRYDKEYRSGLLAELRKSLPDTTIIEVPVEYTDDDSSSVGINVNSTVTFNNIYMPVFGMKHEKAVLDTVQKNTTKRVHTVRSNGVATGGGSVRCLTWQLTGENAEKLILAARRD